jgi:hypothetical protein
MRGSFVVAYPILFADTAGIFEISGPGKSQSTHFEVSVRKHVSQTERVVVLLCKTKTTIMSYRCIDLSFPRYIIARNWRKS